ncbi:hypothetical protein Scep_012277 [Stephania cephalantha]|uniref:Uncharacterized protein n=1 Tax=Stephania cephalantha TaxID=152367 RepID=A0AAP0JET5_9MAGN
MARDIVTVVDAFDMADRVITFFSRADNTYETIGTATQSEGGTTSTETAVNIAGRASNQV